MVNMTMVHPDRRDGLSCHQRLSHQEQVDHPASIGRSETREDHVEGSSDFIIGFGKIKD